MPCSDFEKIEKKESKRKWYIDNLSNIYYT